MAWMLDTNICIYLIKRRPASVLEKFKSISPGQIALSVITIAELAYGARKSASPEKNLTALHQFIVPFEVLPFDYAATVEYGSIRAVLEKDGNPIGALDTFIAAHARSLDYILVTNNEKEFRRVSGLRVENWVE